MKEIEIKCGFCEITFNKKLKHYNYLLKNKKTDNFYCSKKCNQLSNKPTMIIKKCDFCEQDFETKICHRIKKCCSRTCSAKLSTSYVNRENISKAIKLAIANGKRHGGPVRKYVDKFCSVCGCLLNTNTYRRRTTCSEICKKTKISLGGRKSVQIQGERRRSKNEIYFAELCKNKFDKVDTNLPLFNGWDADIIIHDKKVAVLWNGKWHYEKLKENHSVSQVQNRDAIKLKEIIKCGYTPYVIKDLGSENKYFVENEFEKFSKYIMTV